MENEQKYFLFMCKMHLLVILKQTGLRSAATYYPFNMKDFYCLGLFLCREELFLRELLLNFVTTR